nr:uncharacterized protein LOC124817197 [Hydra vulgaris]
MAEEGTSCASCIDEIQVSSQSSSQSEESKDEEEQMDVNKHDGQQTKEKIKSTYVPLEFFKHIGPSKTGKSGLLFECRMKNCPRQRTSRALWPIFMTKNSLSNLRRHI